jgi:hypothetical protein
MAEGLHPRIRAHLELALLADCGCAETLATLTRRARKTGFTGAEIDAALEGRSFGTRAAAAVTYACALKSGEQERVAQARSRALRLGLTDGELQAIAAESAGILTGRAGMSDPRGASPDRSAFGLAHVCPSFHRNEQGPIS